MDSTRSIETLNRLSQHVEIKGIRIICHNDIKLSSTIECRIDELSKDTKTKEAVQGTSRYWAFKPPILVSRSQYLSVTPQASRKKYLFNRPKFEKHIVDVSSLLNAAIQEEKYQASTGQTYSLEVDAQLSVLRPEDLLQLDLATCTENIFQGISGLRTFLKALDDNSDVLDACVSFVSDFSKIHPIVQATILVVSIPYTILKYSQEYEEKMTTFVKELRELLPLLSDISQVTEKAALQDHLKDIFETIVNITQLIANYLRKDRTGKIFSALFKQKSLDDYFKELKERVQHLKDFLLIHIAMDVKKLGSSDRLERLIKVIEGDDLPDACWSGTRQHIFDIFDSWCHDKKSNLLWIFGSPGAGKSAIASSLLAIANIDIGIYLDKYLEKEPTYLGNGQRTDDFKTLIVEAFKSIPSENHSQAPIIIIDALDECDTSEEQKIFLKSLADWAKEPEFNFKMIVTSRNQKEIQDAIGDCSYHLHIHTGEAVDTASTQDIQIFLKDRFQQLKVDLRSFPNAINQMSQYAAGLFIWAKLATSYIAAGIVTQRLEDVLMNMGQLGQFKNNNNLNLDRLYAQILYSIFDNCTQKEKKQYEMILGSLIFAKSPLSINILEVIFDNPESKITSEVISTALDKFSPLLLSLDLNDGDAPLHLCHLSLQDFFQEDPQEGSYYRTTKNKNMKRFHIAFEAYSKHLPLAPQLDICHITSTESVAHICLGLLRYMNKELHFNMGQLESSYFSNKDITDLSQRLDGLISKSLRFSCQWWHEHLPENVDTSSDMELHEEVDTFLKNKLLFWVEVMSLIEQVPAAAGAMQYAAHIFKARFDITLNLNAFQTN
ncbi:hypothetical protein M422DRAFT_244095 [Sphaerobolus stellatus SS14]|nr:hypothetical protein M422DRAFT_244095 [Sphaerobolus stellatus SS14]